jgi:hypothetical protein|tara:strand:+ start:142 stop:552 length:411 start_codon:yes stop_codon:yes gene_type:complete
VLVQALDFVVGDSLGKTDSIVLSVEDGIEFSHENVTDEEHLLGDIHGHNGGGTGHLWLLLGFVARLTLVFSGALGKSLSSLGLWKWSIGHLFGFDLSHYLWTERSHIELHFLGGLSELYLLSWEHPLFVGEGIWLS